MPPVNPQKIIERLKQVDEWRPGRCLYVAHYVAEMLHEAGERAVIQAGSLQWPRIRAEDDDGVSPTHFSYMWEVDSPLNWQQLIRELLPEMHVWVGLPERQQILDFSVVWLPVECERLLGLDWTNEMPPEWLWCDVEGLPERVVYTPDMAATVLACRILSGLFRPKYLKFARDVLTRTPILQ